MVEERCQVVFVGGSFEKVTVVNLLVNGGEGSDYVLQFNGRPVSSLLNAINSTFCGQTKCSGA